MKITEHLQQSSDTLISFEILPPLKGESIQTVFNLIEPLMEFKPPFIDVTYHREEYIYKDRGQGLLEKRSIRKRPGTVGICAAIMNKFNVDAVPHIICGGFSKEETENALIDLNFLGIENVMLLRGDAIKSEQRFVPDPDGHSYAIDLVQQVSRMNQGLYLDNDIQNPQATHFCIGVAAYPEKHFEAPNKKSDMKYLKQKIDSGADYIVTQMFFDNKQFHNFVDQCRNEGIEVPIIPGIKPLTHKSQLATIPRVFHVDIPADLSDAIEACKNDDDVKKVGIEWAIHQCKDLLKQKIPCLHFYTMTHTKIIEKVVKEIR